MTMIYKVRVNKRIRNIKVYNVLKRKGEKPNFLTTLFMKLFLGNKKEEV